MLQIMGKVFILVALCNKPHKVPCCSERFVHSIRYNIFLFLPSVAVLFPIFGIFKIGRAVLGYYTSRKTTNDTFRDPLLYQSPKQCTIKSTSILAFALLLASSISHTPLLNSTFYQSSHVYWDMLHFPPFFFFRLLRTSQSIGLSFFSLFL